MAIGTKVRNAFTTTQGGRGARSALALSPMEARLKRAAETNARHVMGFETPAAPAVAAAPTQLALNEEQIVEANRHLIQMVDPAAIRQLSQFARKYVKDEIGPDQAELEASLAEHGMIYPLLVRFVTPMPDAPNFQEKYKFDLIAGYRRYKAATDLKWDAVPVIVLNISTVDALALALTENLQRKNPNAVELGLTLQYMQEQMKLELKKFLSEDLKLLGTATRSKYPSATIKKLSAVEYERVEKIFGETPSWLVTIVQRAREEHKPAEVTLADLAARVNLSENSLRDKISIAALPAEVVDMIGVGAIGPTQARCLLRLPDDAQKRRLAREIMRSNQGGRAMTESDILARVNQMRGKLATPGNDSAASGPRIFDNETGVASSTDDDDIADTSAAHDLLYGVTMRSVDLDTDTVDTDTSHELPALPASTSAPLLAAVPSSSGQNPLDDLKLAVSFAASTHKKLKDLSLSDGMSREIRDLVDVGMQWLERIRDTAMSQVA